MMILALYNLLSMSRMPTHLPTLRDLLLAHSMQWYKKPWFIGPFEYLAESDDHWSQLTRYWCMLGG